MTHVDNKYLKVIEGLLKSFKYLKIIHLNFGKSDKADKQGFKSLIKVLGSQRYLEDFQLKFGGLNLIREN